MSRQKNCQRDGGPSLDINYQYHGVTRDKLHPDCVVRQCTAAREAAYDWADADPTWCALARLTHSDYRASIETLRINGWGKRKAA